MERNKQAGGAAEAFQIANPQLVFEARNTFTLCCSSSERFTVTHEVLALEQLAVALEHDEARGSQGVCVAEEDSRDFARAVADRLGGHLSIHQLQLLIAELSDELRRQELARSRY